MKIHFEKVDPLDKIIVNKDTIRTCFNKNCRREFTAIYERHYYCTKECRGRAKRERLDYWNRTDRVEKRNSVDIGTAAELLVCYDLLRKELNVFRTVSAAGCFDLIAVHNDGRLWRIEVKKGLKSRTTKVRFGKGLKSYR